MENFLREDVVFKLRKTRQELALSLMQLGAIRAGAQGTGYSGTLTAGTPIGKKSSSIDPF